MGIFLCDSYMYMYCNEALVIFCIRNCNLKIRFPQKGYLVDLKTFYCKLSFSELSLLATCTSLHIKVKT